MTKSPSAPLKRNAYMQRRLHPLRVELLHVPLGFMVVFYML